MSKQKIEIPSGGFVELLNWMGTDLSVVNAARVSMDKESDWDPVTDIYESRKLSERDRAVGGCAVSFRQNSLFDEDPEPFSDATFSPCGKYRYTLTRMMKPCANPRLINWVMLNPSTADEREDDQTIRKCIGFTERAGYDGFIVTNLFAFRATEPKDMKAAVEPIGPDNDRVIVEVASGAALVICAWGTPGKHRGRAAQVRQLLRNANLHALHLCKDGEPGHPLMLGYNRTPFKWVTP